MSFRLEVARFEGSSRWPIGFGQISSSTFLAIIDQVSICRTCRAARPEGGWQPFRRARRAFEISNLRSQSVTVIDKCGQALKGVWWMSWHREATKDAAACENLRGAGKRASIRRSLNGETRRHDLPSRPAEFNRRRRANAGN